MEFLPLAQIKKNNHTVRFYFCILFFCVIQLISADTQNLPSEVYPLIPLLSSHNPVFKQYAQDVERSYQLLAKKETPPSFFYRYLAKEGETLITIAARCNIPYETIATVNRLSNGSDPIADRMLFLPTVAGLFINEKPAADIELLLSGKEFDPSDFPQTIYVRYANNESVPLLFYQNVRLNPTERAFFLDRGFIFPLPKGIQTSSFGMRKNPVTGNYRFHNGIDLASPSGTTVYASRGGEIVFAGYNSLLGNHVIINHDNNTQTIYGHLEKILVELNQKIITGYTIGKVGSTGQSTGPHLHFEIRINGKAQNPDDLVKKNKRS